MSSSKRLLQLGFLATAMLSATVLGACTLTPVYSEANAARANLQLAFAKPTSRIEQIISQDLALHLGTSDSPTATLATVSASAGARSLALSSTVNPAKPYDLTVTATLTLTRRDGSNAAPIVVSRRATANYTTNSQVLADTAAVDAANEQAAHAVAESLRLGVLAALSR